MKTLPFFAVVLAMLGFTSSAFAETLNYNFTMTITSISDGYGVFDDLSEGGNINVSVQFDTKADRDGEAIINVAELGYVAKGYWVSSWSDVQYKNGYWDAYSGIVADVLVVNNVAIHSGSVHQEVYLDFTRTSSGDFALTGGSVFIGVYNGSSAQLTAKYTTPPPPPTSVPELDPGSGMGALALVGGGLTIAWSRRRRPSTLAA